MTSNTAAALDPTLDAIVETIAAACQPSRIILFGSRARGDAREDSDYDVVVELNFTGSRHDVRSRVGSALNGTGRLEVDVHVRAPGEIETRMHDVGWMDYDMGREGVVVYVAGYGATWQPAAPRAREIPTGVPKSVAGWLRLADTDLLVIKNELAAGENAWNAVCFHAQQAAEKYLKALLIQRNIRPERTHKLSAVLTAARDAGYALNGLDGDCEFLTQFAVKPRYPGDDNLEPDPIMYGEETGRQAAESVRRIVGAVRPLLLPL